MKKLLLATALFCATTYASANGCPGEMRAVDAKLPAATLSAEDMTKVKTLRQDGEKFHKEGKHTESMRALGEAKKLLGI